jgi:hypothetical protein
VTYLFQFPFRSCKIPSRSKRLDQITLSDRIFSELRELDRELAKIPPESQYDNARNQVYLPIFSTLDYFSFLVNQKMVDDRQLIEYMSPIIISYYEHIFMKHPLSMDERVSKSFQQFKKILFQTQEIMVHPDERRKYL